MKPYSHGCAILGLLLFGHARADFISLTPSMDTMVVAGQSQNRNFSGTSVLVTPWADSFSNGRVATVGLLNFDLPDISGPFSSATLYLYQEQGASSDIFNLYRNTSAWTQSSVTWATKPSYVLSPAGSIALNDGLSGLYRKVDVTSIVNGWSSAKYPNDGFTLESSIEGAQSGVIFASSFPPPPPVWDLPGPASASLPSLNPNTPYLVLQTDSQVSSTPEPTSLILAGIAGMGFIARRNARCVKANWRSAFAVCRAVFRF